MTDKPAADDADARLATRRQSLLAISRFAAATAPAMLVLLSPLRHESAPHSADVASRMGPY